MKMIKTIQISIFIVSLIAFIALIGIPSQLAMDYPVSIYFPYAVMAVLIVLSFIGKNRILKTLWIAGLLFCLVAIPKISNLITKASEGNMCGNLATQRIALDEYYKQNGKYPESPRQLQSAPEIFILRLYPEHKRTTEVIIAGSSNTPADTGTWLYSPATGRLIINCTHYRKSFGSDRWDSM